MTMACKPRLDEILVERGLCPDLHAAQAAVMAGQVVVGQHRETSAGKRLDAAVDIRLKDSPGFVSRGGKKLQGALDAFCFDATGLNCADLGASSGGFTDCLLQAGAARVSAVDVGYGQFVWSLRNDPRVDLFERTNVRGLDPAAIKGPFDLVVGDLSFISLTAIMPEISSFMLVGAHAILLVKPQFEAHKSELDEGGVVHDAAVHARVIREVAASAESHGLNPLALAFSPIKGPKGNMEYLLLVDKPPAARLQGSIMSPVMIDEVVDKAHVALGGR